MLMRDKVESNKLGMSELDGNMATQEGIRTNLLLPSTLPEPSHPTTR